MKRIATSVVTVAIATVASGGLLTGLAASSHAASTPPWEPNKSSVGGLTFYNKAGHAITHGKISAGPIAAYVVGSSTVRKGDDVATLVGALPKKGEKPAAWSTEILSASTSYPSKKAPKKAAKLPVVTGSKSDLSIADLASDFPTTSKAGYENVYQLRLLTSKAGRSVSTKYDSADILIKGKKWSIVYDAAIKAAKTKTTLKASAKKVKAGAKLVLSIKVKPGVSGKATIYDGKKKLKSVKVKNGKGTFSTKKLAKGKHSLKAKFAPSNASADKSSTSKTVKVTVT